MMRAHDRSMEFDRVLGTCLSRCGTYVSVDYFPFNNYIWIKWEFNIIQLFLFFRVSNDLLFRRETPVLPNKNSIAFKLKVFGMWWRELYALNCARKGTAKHKPRYNQSSRICIKSFFFFKYIIFSFQVVCDLIDLAREKKSKQQPLTTLNARNAALCYMLIWTYAFCFVADTIRCALFAIRSAYQLENNNG